MLACRSWRLAQWLGSGAYANALPSSSLRLLFDTTFFAICEVYTGRGTVTVTSGYSFLHRACLERSARPVHLHASSSCPIAAKVAAFRTDMGKEYAVKKAWNSAHERFVLGVTVER